MKQTLVSASQLGQILRTARRANGLSQDQAASRVGLSQSRLSAMELEPRSVTAEQLFALMALYGLELTVQPRGDAATPQAQTEW